jgi:hypothetical protein
VGGRVGKKWFQGLRRLLCSQSKAKTWGDFVNSVFNATNGNDNVDSWVGCDIAVQSLEKF